MFSFKFNTGGGIWRYCTNILNFGRSSFRTTSIPNNLDVLDISDAKSSIWVLMITQVVSRTMSRETVNRTERYVRDGTATEKVHEMYRYNMILLLLQLLLLSLQ